MSERIWIRKKDWHIEHFNPHNSGYQTWMLASESYQTLKSEREAREEADETCTHWMVEANKARQRVAELERERQLVITGGHDMVIDEQRDAARTEALEDAATAELSTDPWDAVDGECDLNPADAFEQGVRYGIEAKVAAIRAKKGGEG